MKKTLFIAFFLTCAGVISYTAAHADPPKKKPSAIPIDGGASLLLVAGAGLAARKVLKMKKRSSEL